MGYVTPIAENHMGKKMEHETQTGTLNRKPLGGGVLYKVYGFPTRRVPF